MALKMKWVTIFTSLSPGPVWQLCCATRPGPWPRQRQVQNCELRARQSAPPIPAQVCEQCGREVRPECHKDGESGPY